MAQTQTIESNDSTARSRATVGTADQHLANDAIPKPGEPNLPAAARPETAQGLPVVHFVGNDVPLSPGTTPVPADTGAGGQRTAAGVKVDVGSDGKPTAYHSNGFSFEYHKDNDTWYYHQDSGGDYVKIDIPTLNDDGTVSTRENGGFNQGRAHELNGSGQSSEDWRKLKENDPFVATLLHGAPSQLLGDIFRGDKQAVSDLGNGDILGAAGDLVKRDINEFHDLASFASGNNPISAWDSGQQLETDLAAGGEGSEQFKRDLDSLNKLWDGTSYGGTTRGDSRFYDDNAWIGIAMMDAYKQNPNNPEYLDRAKKLFDFVSSGENGTESLSHPGGLFWQQGEGYRSAVSTAGATQLALDLYQQTHDQKYLTFAQKQYDWMNQNLKDKNGLFIDGMDPDGGTDSHKAQFSYNQGLMLGNATMLYQITGDSKYLDQAKDIAKKSLEQYGPNGAKDWRFIDQEPFFNAVYFKNLMQLDAIAPDNSYRQALSRYSGELKNKLNSGNIDNWHDHTLTYASSGQVFALADQYPPQN